VQRQDASAKWDTVECFTELSDAKAYLRTIVEGQPDGKLNQDGRSGSYWGDDMRIHVRIFR
jgi:hypothetical protein